MPKKKSKLSKAIETSKRKKEPIWKGPESSDSQGGVTQSLLNRFLICRERFRLYAIEGLKPVERYDHKLGFGNLWHAAEESQTKKREHWTAGVLREKLKQDAEYPMDRSTILKWYNIVLVQFPTYLEYWKQFPLESSYESLLQEEVFQVPYELPSGKIVFLRGKWDGVDLVKVGDDKGIWLREHKTKGNVEQLKVERQLRFDLQTMLYLVALESKLEGDFWNRSNKRYRGQPLRGVRYNVIRRPLSGGKGTIRKRKSTKNNPNGETDKEFYSRLSEDYIKKEPETYFHRWKVDVFPEDFARFKIEFLNPCLEQVCNWYNYITDNLEDPFGNLLPFGQGDHYRTPYIFSPITDGGNTELDALLDTGNSTGFTNVDSLFRELED